SSKLLSEELATLLTGRQLYFEIFPLSFPEFLNFNGLDIDSQKTAILNSLEIKRLFRDYFRFGGFPEVTLGKNEEFKRRILVSYYEDIINRDIVQRFKIKKIDKLKSLVRFYLTNISSYVSFNKISKFIQLPVETIRRFSSFIETSDLLFFIKRFSYSVKEQENSPRKIYSIDVGLSNAVGFKFSENYRRLAENIVALKLKEIQSHHPLTEIYYWKNQYGDRETDFLIKERLDITQAIQVCWDITNRETKDRELKGLLKSMEEFKLKKGLIITEDFEGKEKIKGKEIIYKALWKWLLDL
ncbi:MAG: ATP-binding protein, partial [Candidatus Omnitrophota bacterium]